MPGFLENERSGLLGKVISYLDTSTMNSYQRIDGEYAVSDIKTELLKYFTNSELDTLLKKILECQQIDIFTIFRLNRIYFTNYITDSGYKTIFEYLNLWRYIYWNGGDITKFLCGLIENIRTHRRSVIDKVSTKLEKKYPEDAISYINQYLDKGDLIKQNTRGGKTMRKYARKNQKQNKKSKRV